MKRVAAIDCGTNSIRLLIADVDGSDLRDVVREMRIVRLGEGIDKSGDLDAAAVERTLAAVSEYAQLIADAKVDATRFVGTSAMRDARNGSAFIEAVRNILGVTPEVIPGAEEAQLSFRGAINSLRAPAPQLVVDIGGGSTEFVFGPNRVEEAISIDMGSVRLTERFYLIPGEKDTQLVAYHFVEEQLDRVEKVIDFSDLGSLVGVAGTVTSLAAYHFQVPRYSPETTHGQKLTWSSWQDAARYMIEAPVDQKAALPFMPQGRADVIEGGAIIWSAIVERVSSRAPGLDGAFVSEHDILDGIAESLV